MSQTDIYRENALIQFMNNKNLDSALSIVRPIYWIAAIGGILLLCVLFIWGLFGYVNSTTDCYGFYYTSGYANTYYCNDNGFVLSIDKESGSFIRQGDALYTYSDSNNGEIKKAYSEVTGIILKNNIFPGSSICKGQKAFTIRAFSDPDLNDDTIYIKTENNLATKSYNDFEKTIYLLVPGEEISKIHEGENVTIKPFIASSVPPITGEITKVGSFIASESEYDALFGLSVSSLVSSVLANKIICECKITDINGLDEIPYLEGDTVNASIITGRTHPFDLLFSKFFNI